MNSKYLCPWIGQQYFGVSLGNHDVYPCFRLLSFPEMRIGKVNIDARGQVKLDINKPDLMEKELSQRLRGECSESDCQYHRLCLGGCRSMAYVLAKRQGDNNPLYAGQDICLTRILDELSNLRLAERKG